MKPETPKFITKAKESLKASEILAKQKLCNFAASRAYYTMFYIAEAFLWEKDLSFSSHSAVIAAFGRDIVKVGIVPTEFHRYLITAQRKRTQADYGIEDDVQISLEDTQILIEQSRNFIAIAEKLLLE
ncbi:HEPN domain-containing protein [Picosynechococcus sp. NKBG042902]|uniref:HEPN domain-containing protein n=1 Tax=Picosynechococcus sp. NKBG042902 TaxID=490193 RepID=UPI0004AA944A|nr:HEPN domain-containing protein [Picosynechococcus sp. NKBG042902]